MYHLYYYFYFFLIIDVPPERGHLSLPPSPVSHRWTSGGFRYRRQRRRDPGAVSWQCLHLWRAIVYYIQLTFKLFIPLSNFEIFKVCQQFMCPDLCLVEM